MEGGVEVARPMGEVLSGVASRRPESERLGSRRPRTPTTHAAFLALTPRPTVRLVVSFLCWATYSGQSLCPSA